MSAVSSFAPRPYAQPGRRPRMQGSLMPGLIGSHLRRAERAVFEHFQNSLADLGLTPGEFGILLLIYENEGLSQTELGRAIHADRSSVVALLDRFEHSNLVARRPSLLDRRTHALALTEEGTRLMQDALPRVEAHERAIASRLSPGERMQLLELLARLAT